MKGTQDPAVAAIDVDCADSETLMEVTFTTSVRGSVATNTGTECDSSSDGKTFACRPSGSGSLVSVRFKAEDGDVCDPRLTVDFRVDTTGGREQSNNVKISGCSASGGSSGSGDSGGAAGSDDGTTPQGGVDSGAGGTAPPPAGAVGVGPGLGAAAVLIAMLVGGFLARRPRTGY